MALENPSQSHEEVLGEKPSAPVPLRQRLWFRRSVVAGYTLVIFVVGALTGAKLRAPALPPPV